MAIVKMLDENKLKMHVFLKNGEAFLAKDIPASPFGEYEKLVSFAEGKSVTVFPLSEVAKIEFYESEDQK